MKDQVFDVDWFTRNLPHLRVWFEGCKFQHGIEIGSHEGRSASFWLGEGICEVLMCVDPWAGKYADVEERFNSNVLDRWPRRAVKRKLSSAVLLPKLLTAGRKFDFGYVDGDHNAGPALMDMVLVWQMLISGGVMLFDDVGLVDPEFAVEPKAAADAFMSCFAPEIASHQYSPVMDVDGMNVQQLLLVKK